MTFPIQMSTLLPTTSTTQQTNSNSSASASDVQKSFSKELSSAFNTINDTEKDADTMVTQMANGNVDNLHNVTIALEKSEIMLNLAVEVRDKAVSAYQEIMRMQV